MSPNEGRRDGYASLLPPDDDPWRKWVSAMFMILGGSGMLRGTDATVRPLADLLRGETEIPPIVRLKLADMLDPSKNWQYNMLELKKKWWLSKKKQNAIVAALLLSDKIKGGLNLSSAISEVAVDLNVEDRTIYRYLEDDAELSAMVSAYKAQKNKPR